MDSAVDTLAPVIFREIERHKYHLSAAAACDVGFDSAYSDWYSNHYPAFCRFRYEQLLKLQNLEIGKYKWIRSEQEKRDIGREAALEWVIAYAKDFRTTFEREWGTVEI